MQRMNGFALAAAVAAFAIAAGCGGGGSSATTPGTAATAAATAGATSAATASGSDYATAYRQAGWSSAVTLTFSGSCSVTFHTTGVPPYHANYYLAPVSAQYPTAVAVTPVSQTQMAVTPYSASSISSQTVTVNLCPAKAASTTATNMGPIGYLLSGEAIYNPYEGNGANTPAMSDNVSYTFTTSSGVTETASFIDSCNSHPTPLTGGYTWHHHGIPACLVSQLDGSAGPSHLLGFALDGFPIYGGRDINGNTIAVSQLDACNGITSPTPEFPNGAYHYVLPIGVTGKQSSINCYAGTVTQAQLAFAGKRLCGMGPQALRREQIAARRIRKTAYVNPLRPGRSG